MARFLKLSVTSTSSDGLIAVNSTEPAPSQNVSQPEIAPNTTDASMPSHEATEQFSDRDSVLVECELNSRDGANGSAASTSKQAGDVCVAITPNCWCPCTILCSLWSATTCEIETQTKKASLLLSHKCRAHGVHHTTEEDRKEDSGAS